MHETNGNEQDLAQEQRSSGITVDLERLELHAKDLYLDRFVAYVKKARGEHGRYLTLRPGDETAIRAAGDGSEDFLDEVTVDEPSG